MAHAHKDFIMGLPDSFGGLRFENRGGLELTVELKRTSILYYTAPHAKPHKLVTS